MIALDTNVLLRDLVRDDPAQAAAAAKLLDSLSSESPGFVSLIVICELVWALDYTYRQSRDTIAATLKLLVDVPQLVVEQQMLVERAIGGVGDIADMLIHAVGAAHGTIRTVTFDRKFAKLDGVDLIATENAP